VIVALIATALILIAAGFETSRVQRARRECDAEGHLWAPAGMGDHPDVSYICNRCGLAW
jgi:hypothetical protein